MDLEKMGLTRSSTSRRNFLRASAALGILGATSPLLAACGSSSSPADGATTNPTPASGSSATAASSASDSTSSAVDPSIGAGKTIAVANNGTAPYSQFFCSGILQAVAGTGYQVSIHTANLDVATELTNLTTVVSQGVAGIVNLPVSVSSSEQGAKLASAAGIPITNALWAGSDSADQYWTAVADLDSVAGGQMIGDWLKANTKPGKIVVVQGIVGQGFSERIDEGLDKSLSGSGYEIVVRQQGYFDRSKAIGVVQDALQAHPDLSIVVDYAAVMGDGISQYLQQHGLSNLTHVTSDGDEEMMEWIKTPYLSAVRYYSAAQTGLLCAQAIRDKLEKGSTEFKLPVFQKVVTGDDIAATLAQVPMSYPDLFDKVTAAGF